MKSSSLFYNKILPVLAPIVLSLLIGVIIIVSIGANISEVLPQIVDNILGNSYNMAEIFVAMIPLICTGLSIAFANKTGLFNIGAEGQFIIGGLSAAVVVIKFASLSPTLLVIVAVLAGIIGGALWAFVPGLLKALFNVSEVVVTIMLNYTALYVSQYVVGHIITGSSPTVSQSLTNPETKLGLLNNPTIAQFFANGRLGNDLFIALVALVIYWFVINRTTFGFELRAGGFNANGALYAGMKVKRNIVLSMVIAGAFAGLGGAILALGPVGFVSANAGFEGYGFTGIAVALLGGSTAIGVFLSALLFGFLNVVAIQLNFIGIPKEIAAILIGLIVFFVGANYVFKQLGIRQAKKQLSKQQEAKNNG